MASVEGLNRVPGAGIEPAASTFRAWRHDQQQLPRIREGGFEPPPPDSKSGSLPLADSREPRESNPPVGPGSPPLPAARDAANSLEGGTGKPNAVDLARARDVPLDQSLRVRRKEGSRTPKAHRSPGFEPGAVADRLALPRRAAPAAGIEPASPRLTAGRSYQHELHRNRRVSQSGWPDSNRRSPAPEAGGLARLSHIPSRSITDKCPAGVEPARPPWQGGRLPLHHGHDRRPRIVKESREHRVGLEPTSPPYEGGVFAAGRPVLHGVGPEGLEPSPNRLRAGCAAAKTSVPIGIASRPGRSRTSAARLSAECSPVELQAASVCFSRWSAPGELNPSSLAYKASALTVEPGAMGPEGFEPPPTGLKGRHAAATPRPRSGHLVPGYAFDPDHRLGPRYEFCR